MSTAKYPSRDIKYVWLKLRVGSYISIIQLLGKRLSKNINCLVTFSQCFQHDFVRLWWVDPRCSTGVQGSMLSLQTIMHQSGAKLRG